MVMKTNFLYLLLAIIFILHNMEELKRFNELKVAYYPNFLKKIIDRFVFKNAIIILSVIVSVVFILNFYVRNNFRRTTLLT